MQFYPAGGPPVPREAARLPPLRSRRVALGGRVFDLLCPISPMALIDAALEATVELRPPYWADIWPAEVALGRILIASPLECRRVLELGAGIGLAGLAAAAAGARVVVTDREPAALALAKRNAARNRLDIDVRCLDWNAADARERAGGEFDLIVAGDVLYDEDHLEPLLALLAALLADAPQGATPLPRARQPAALLADPDRAGQQPFCARAAALEIDVERSTTHFFYDGRGRSITLLRLTRPAG